MRLYCKDFDEKKCVYNSGACCGWREVEEDYKKITYLLYYSNKEAVCGKRYNKHEYVTKFEYLMLKKLKEK